jgi:transcriptional regulator with XRE-family HTH domain
MEKQDKAKVLRLKELMQQKGISRDEFSKAAGVSVTTISNINSGLHLPSIETLLDLAKILDVDVRELFNPTKVGTVSVVEVSAAREHLKNALRSLGEDLDL